MDEKALGHVARGIDIESGGQPLADLARRGRIVCAKLYDPTEDWQQYGGAKEHAAVVAELIDCAERLAKAERALRDIRAVRIRVNTFGAAQAAFEIAQGYARAYPIEDPDHDSK